MNNGGLTEKDINGTRALWVKSMPGPPPVDPVASVVAGASKIAELRPDPDVIRTAAKNEFLSMFIPCFLCFPCWILGCQPCNLWCGPKDTYEEFAKGRSLTLTEKGLIYRLEAGALRETKDNWCCEPMRIEHPIEIHILLDESFALSESFESSCCVPTKTLAITVNGTLLARLDNTKDVTPFIAAVKEQASKAQLHEVDEISRRIHQIVLEFYAFVASQTVPTRRVRSGSDTRTEVDQAQVQLQAHLFYTTLMDRIANANNNNMMGMMGVSIMTAPVALEMTRGSFGGSGGGANRVQLMSTSDVQNMLRELGLFDQYGPAFEKRNVDGSLLSVIDDMALQELGVLTSLDRKAILAWVVRQQQLPMATAIQSAVALT